MRDFHTHSTFSDGKNTPEEMILEAIEKGMSAIGFSDHSYTSFDLSYCMREETYDEYRKEISRLKEKYSDKIKIYCGIEQDYWSETIPFDFDYIIGSAHYIRVGDDYFPVDDGADILLNAADKYFEGDIYSVIEAYFDTVSDVARKTKCNIIGHFDLIKKYNQKTPFFDENNIRYLNARHRAIDHLIKYNIPFEINTGSISRGYRDDSYPSDDLIEYVINCGGKFILSSDSHTKINLCSNFEKYKDFIND